MSDVGVDGKEVWRMMRKSRPYIGKTLIYTDKMLRVAGRGLHLLNFKNIDFFLLFLSFNNMVSKLFTPIFNSIVFKFLNDKIFFSWIYIQKNCLFQEKYDKSKYLVAVELSGVGHISIVGRAFGGLGRILLMSNRQVIVHCTRMLCCT